MDTKEFDKYQPKPLPGNLFSFAESFEIIR